MRCRRRRVAGICGPGAQRYHDVLAEAMRRLLASGLLPRRAGQPVKALVHVSFAELCDLDAGSALQDKWIGEYRARWAARRAAASVATGDIDAGAVEELIALCVRWTSASLVCICIYDLGHRLMALTACTPSGRDSKQIFHLKRALA